MASEKADLAAIRKGTAQLIMEEELKLRLAKKKLRVKYGADPTSPDLHLGHAVLLKKLRLFQDMGHMVVFVIGDFTAQVGDPSGQNKTRPRLTPEQVERNARTYLEQVYLILDKQKTEVAFNSSWLASLNMPEIIELASQTTVARLLERDDFKKRWKEEKPIALHELLYPLLQAYDSVQIKADLEVGGSDQLYNLLLGRDLQQHFGQPPQIVLTMPLLVGTDGKKKMSKSFKNDIALRDKPEDMYGKIMRIPDEVMADYAKLLDVFSEEEWKEKEEAMKQGQNPMEVKHELAFAITSFFYREEQARQARDYFCTVFSKREKPDQRFYRVVNSSTLDLSLPVAKLLVQLFDEIKSNSEARRLIRQRGVKINDIVVEDPHATLALKAGDTVQLGKRRRVKIN